ncbi:MAG: hypothetical protein ACI4ET_12660 [Bilifractor sp.]
MTIKELSQLYYLDQAIERDKKELEKLENQISTRSPVISDMPHGSRRTTSEVERLAVEITDLQAIISARAIQRIHERARLERYIGSIEDTLTQQIFSLRFVDCLDWVQVAEALGGHNTAEGVKKRCYRYLDSHPDDKIDRVK